MGNNSFVTENFTENGGFYPQLENFCFKLKENGGVQK
jgi:hypothetical protein